MTSKKCIFFFGITRFDAPIASTSYTLAKELAKNGNSVYYIEYPYTVADRIKLRNSREYQFRKAAIAGKNDGLLPSGVTNLTIVQIPILLSIHFLPEGKLYRNLLRYNEQIIIRRLKKIIEKHALNDIIYINSFIFHYPNLSTYLNTRLSIYHCVDPVFTPYDAKHGIVSEKILIEKSDMVICTSPDLFRKKLKAHPHTYFVPNAANIAHSIQAINPDLSIHSSLKSIPRPIVGYLGNIERRIDFELMQIVAEKNKNISFVFAGPVEKELAPDFFFKIPNIYFTGAIPYDQMPNMIKGFNVAIIPFKKTPNSGAVFPLKLFEYLGAGKPIVATDFNLDLKNFTNDLVSYCHNADEFSTAINDALDKDSPEMQEKRIKLASEHTWEKRAAEFENLIEKHLRKETTTIIENVQNIN